MKPIIREFLDKMPEWFDERRVAANVAWPNGNCCLCGINYRKLEELHNALKEDYGEIKINIKKE